MKDVVNSLTSIIKRVFSYSDICAWCLFPSFDYGAIDLLNVNTQLNFVNRAIGR